MTSRGPAAAKDPELEIAIANINRMREQNERERGQREKPTTATELMKPITRDSDTWRLRPVMDEAAYMGLLARFVKYDAPHTEADPAGLLCDFHGLWQRCWTRSLLFD